MSLKEIALHVNSSLLSRKRLAEGISPYFNPSLSLATKAFKNKPSLEKQDIKSLLSLYQKEVDALTKRAEFAEGVCAEGAPRKEPRKHKVC